MTLHIALLQLYLHHIFGPSDLITGEGAEFRGGLDTPPLPDPYYTVINGSKFASQMSRYASSLHRVSVCGTATLPVRCTYIEHVAHASGLACKLSFYLYTISAVRRMFSWHSVRTMHKVSAGRKFDSVLQHCRASSLLSGCMSVCMSTHWSMPLPACLPASLSMSPSLCLSLSVSLFLCLSVCLSGVRACLRLSVCLSVCLQSAIPLYRMVNIHVINTLGVAPEDVPRCIECWCTDERHKLKGEHGGGGCCSDALCPSTEPSTTIKTYHLQFTVTYRCALCTPIVLTAHNLWRSFMYTIPQLRS